MVFPQQSSRATSRLGSRRGTPSASKIPLQALLGVLGATFALCTFVIFWTLMPSSTLGGVGPDGLRKKHHPIPALGNAYNAIAMDVISSLSCGSIIAEEESKKSISDPQQGDGIDLSEGEGLAAVSARRRLQMDSGEGDLEGGGPFDDQFQAMDDTPDSVTARHLMCLVAGADKLPERVNKDAFRCDGMGTRREALLDIWASARSQLPLDVIKKALDMAVELDVTLVDKSMHLWAPQGDESVDFLLTGLNEPDGSIQGLEDVMGPGRLFVDVGSGLGLSSLAVSLLYPGTSVLSIEPASPSWLLSRLNFVCNLPPKSKVPNPILAGVGPKNDRMSKMMWRPSSTGTTRAWTPSTERRDDDIELIVRLRTLRSILAEAAAEEDVENDAPSSVVLNVDCEGCEYNLIPALSDEEFDALDTIIGTTGVHWGYIPADKRPSSKRGETTHKRLCQHYDFAKRSIECCAFPDLRVKHAGKPKISEVAGALCGGFNEWAAEKGLYSSNDDYGWSELSSMSDMN